MGKPGGAADRYRRIAILGEGGAGQVWRVEDRLLPGRPCALKQASRPDDAESLRREFATLARLHHPGLVEALELHAPTDDEGELFFTLDYVDGDSLAATVEREGPDGCLSLTAELLRVLAFLHDFDLVHRDLKPENVLVRHRSRLGCRAVVLDLGLAMATSTEAAAAEGRTAPAGTLPYLAPELFEGSAASPRSDLYGLAALIYEVIHGRPPFVPDSNDLNAFVEKVRQGRRARPALPESYPAGLAGWLEELLSPDPAERPGEAREALARLNTACGTSFQAETPAGRAARLASGPPVGRDHELQELWSMLESARGPRVVWLRGAAGMGKSRLLRWVWTEAIREGWDVTAPACRLPFDVEPQADDAVDAALREGRARAATKPTLVLLDEIEAADAMLVRWLERVAREGKAAPLRVVAAVRPGEVRPPDLRRLLEDTATVPTLRQVELEPLDAAGIRAMAERATGTALSDARLRRLVEASEGNPLTAEALLVEDHVERGGKGQAPRVLADSAAARLGLLSESAGQWLEALTVLGNDAPESAITSLARLDPEIAGEAAEECRVAGLARAGGGTWSVDSRSVAERVRARIATDRRAALHREAAERLVELGAAAAEPERLARLWSAAGEPERAVELAREAARRAVQAGAPDRAAEQLAFALRQVADGNRELRLALRREQAAALMSAGLFRAAARAWGASLRLMSGDEERASVLGQQAHALVRAGKFDRARAVAEEALELADETHPLDRAVAHKAIGVALGRQGREREALPVFEQVLELARKQKATEIEAEALQYLATCKARLELPEAETDYLQAIELYRKLGLRDAELMSLIGLASIHQRATQLDRAGQLLDDVRQRAGEAGRLDLVETALSKQAAVATERGRLDEALTLSHEALDQARHLGDRNRLMVDRCRVAEALIGCGRPAEAVDLLRDALKSSTEQIEPDMVDSGRMLLAHALMETPGAGEEAAGVPLGRSLDGFRERRRTRSLLMALVIEMERRAEPGAREPFEPIYMEFEALATGSGVDPEPEIRVRSELARGRFLLDRGNAAGARDEARSAVRIAEGTRLPAYGARAESLLGEALEQLGERDEADAAFRRGAELLDSAASQIADPAIRESFLQRPGFRTLRARTPSNPSGNERRLFALYDMIRALNSETDPEALLETILDMALRVVPTQRGMILLRDPATDTFAVHVTRNLEQETQADALDYSRSIVAQAGAGRSILALDAGRDERFRDLKSVSLYGIHSLMCVPLRCRGTVIGTVYLDSHRAGVLITPEDLRFIEAFADHAALALENARERAALIEENRRLQAAAETRVRFGNLVGRSTAMQRVFELIEKVAASDLPVLIHGESGTGKELVARAIHFHSARKRKIFLTENCAAIPETLLESELFGHVKGAFTGADRDRQGLFEQADGGTLFLDEVGDMSPAMQARLLRVLQEGELRRVGGAKPVQVDVRVLAATHRKLAREVEAGRFREDLLYRLQVLPIELPALRERPEDIGPLVDHFLERIATERGRGAPQIEPRALSVLERFDWPGNVRQLENVLQRLVLMSGDGPITLARLEVDETFRPLMGGRTETAADKSYSLRNASREELQRALAAAGGNREKAARLLGLSRATIYRKIKEFGLQNRR